MPLIIQILGLLMVLGFLCFIWPPIALGVAGLALFALGWVLDKGVAPTPKDVQ